MHTIVRPATVNDAAAICTVVRRSIAECCIEDHRNEPALVEAWLGNKTVSNAQAWLQVPNTYGIVAEVDGSVVGFGMSRAEELLLLYVAPEVRFTGVGKALLHALEAHAASSGISSLRLESTRTAEAFYRRNGFNETGRAIFAFGMEGLPMAKPVVALNSLVLSD